MRDAIIDNYNANQLLIREGESLKMIYASLMTLTKLSTLKPSIIYAAPESGDISKGDYWQSCIFDISRDEMTYEQCSIMIIDGP